MPTNIKAIKEGFSQASHRGVMFWFDQHKDANYRNAEGVAIFEQGRPYWSYVERSSEGVAAPMPVGEVIPMGWTAPFAVPQKYIVRSIGRVQNNGQWLKGAGSTQFFKIDYAGMMKEDREATEAYYTLAVAEAVRLKEPLPRVGQPLSPELRLVVGKPPRSPKIAEAAMAGDKWLLGQQMPIWDAAKGKYIVPENATLARLLRMHSSDYLTPEQDEAAQEVESQHAAVSNAQLTDIVAAQGEMMDMLKAELAALKEAGAEKAKKDEAARERMSKARAAKKPTTAGV